MWREHTTIQLAFWHPPIYQWRCDKQPAHFALAPDLNCFNNFRFQSALRRKNNFIDNPICRAFSLAQTFQYSNTLCSCADLSSSFNISYADLISSKIVKLTGSNRAAADRFCKATWGLPRQFEQDRYCVERKVKRSVGESS